MFSKEPVITYPKKLFTILHLLSEKAVSVLSAAVPAYAVWEIITLVY